MTTRKKLIEVALPLDIINAAAIRENYIYRGNPSAIHKWWAQRPLAIARAILFSQLVDDPSSRPELFPTEKEQLSERERLFEIIRKIVIWENMHDEKTLSTAREEILKSAPAEGLPAVLDPFAGGGTIPLEAQRLGLDALASDLNPVAVLLNKALIEIPSIFSDRSCVNQVGRGQFLSHWTGSEGISEDIIYYGNWLNSTAKSRIGHLYPKMKLPEEFGDGEAEVIAWLWARTIPSPHPATEGKSTPLVKSFVVSNRKNQKIWVEPIVNQKDLTYRFVVSQSSGNPPKGTMNPKGATCLLTGVHIPFDYIREVAKAGHMDIRLMAIVVQTRNGRVYLSPDTEQEFVAKKASPKWKPQAQMADNPRHMTPPLYGMESFGDVFTSRQLTALTTYTELIGEVWEQVVTDSKKAGFSDDGRRLNDGGSGATAYADAIATYLAFAIDKYAMYGCALVPWYAQEDRTSSLFGRQAISMVWDFTEVNPFTAIGGSFQRSVEIIADAIRPISSKVKSVLQK